MRIAVAAIERKQKQEVKVVRRGQNGIDNRESLQVQNHCTQQPEKQKRCIVVVLFGTLNTAHTVHRRNRNSDGSTRMAIVKAVEARGRVIRIARVAYAVRTKRSTVSSRNPRDVSFPTVQAQPNADLLSAHLAECSYRPVPCPNAQWPGCSRSDTEQGLFY